MLIESTNAVCPPYDMMPIRLPGRRVVIGTRKTSRKHASWCRIKRGGAALSRGRPQRLGRRMAADVRANGVRHSSTRRGLCIPTHATFSSSCLWVLILEDAGSRGKKHTSWAETVRFTRLGHSRTALARRRTAPPDAALGETFLSRSSHHEKARVLFCLLLPARAPNAFPHVARARSLTLTRERRLLARAQEETLPHAFCAEQGT